MICPSDRGSPAAQARFGFGLATRQDAAELLDIIESEALAGPIALAYTRRPDAYSSFHLEGDRVELMVCRDRREGRIVGMGACATRSLYVNGRPQEVGYLFGLRSRPQYGRPNVMLGRGYAKLRELEEKRPAFYLTSILAENTGVQRMLERRRPYMPAYEPLTGYSVHAISTSFGRRRRHPGIRRARREDAPELAAFLREEGAGQQFFPVVRGESLDRPPFSGLRVEDFLLLTQGGRIAAAAGLWDQGSYKQYLVTGYHGPLRLLRPLSIVFPIFGWPALPRPGRCLRFLTLSLWAARKGDPGLLSILLDHVPAHFPGYPLCVAGLPEGHALEPTIRSRKHISYRSRIYIVYWPDQQAEAASVDRSRAQYVECGLL